MTLIVQRLLISCPRFRSNLRWLVFFWLRKRWLDNQQFFFWLRLRVRVGITEIFHTPLSAHLSLSFPPVHHSKNRTEHKYRKSSPNEVQVDKGRLPWLLLVLVKHQIVSTLAATPGSFSLLYFFISVLSSAGFQMSQISNFKVKAWLGESFVQKEFKFTLEAIVQIARSLRTKSLDTDQSFNLKGMPVAVINTDLKPIKNNLQRIRHWFFGVNAYKAIWRNRSEKMKNHFSWKSIGKVSPKGPDRRDRTTVKIKRGGSNKITIRKMFDAER